MKGRGQGSGKAHGQEKKWEQKRVPYDTGKIQQGGKRKQEGAGRQSIEQEGQSIGMNLFWKEKEGYRYYTKKKVGMKDQEEINKKERTQRID